MADVFCLASNDEDFPTLAECTRRKGHEPDHHCDTRKRLAWNAEGQIECWREYDHGQPPNRATRRGNLMHPSTAKSQVDYRPGFRR